MKLVIPISLIYLGLGCGFPNQSQAADASVAKHSSVTLYDPDANHLWNRLHQALHVRLTDMGNAEKEQALLPGDQSYHAL